MAPTLKISKGRVINKGESTTKGNIAREKRGRLNIAIINTRIL